MSAAEKSCPSFVAEQWRIISVIGRLLRYPLTGMASSDAEMLSDFMAIVVKVSGVVLLVVIVLRFFECMDFIVLWDLWIRIVTNRIAKLRPVCLNT